MSSRRSSALTGSQNRQTSRQNAHFTSRTFIADGWVEQRRSSESGATRCPQVTRPRTSTKRAREREDVKNQGTCGSCYVFAGTAVAAINKCVYMVAFQKRQDPGWTGSFPSSMFTSSKQELLDCSNKENPGTAGVLPPDFCFNNGLQQAGSGCDGGHGILVLEFLTRNLPHLCPETIHTTIQRTSATQPTILRPSIRHLARANVEKTRRRDRKSTKRGVV